MMLPLGDAADTLDGRDDEHLDCAEVPLEIPLENGTGSAGFMYNVAEHPESIRAVATQMLSTALDTPVAKLLARCANTCPAEWISHIVYKVSPTAFLPEQKQHATCVRLEHETEMRPIVFARKRFESVETLNTWIMEFSQGRGEDGELLYKTCAENCSPRYTFLIARGGDGLSVETEVLCGLARDRKSDRYTISTELRWSCSAE